jgi:hypothetical protein
VFLQYVQTFVRDEGYWKRTVSQQLRLYGFIARPNASYPVPTFQKRWPGAWMEEWFYVKNNLIEREDIKEII